MNKEALLFLISIGLVGMVLATTGGVRVCSNRMDNDDEADRGWGNSSGKPLFCKMRIIQRRCCGIGPGPNPPADPSPGGGPPPAQTPGRKRRTCSDRIKKLCCSSNFQDFEGGYMGRQIDEDQSGGLSQSDLDLISKSISPQVLMKIMKCAIDIGHYVLQGRFEFPKSCCEIAPFGLFCQPGSSPDPIPDN